MSEWTVRVAGPPALALFLVVGAVQTERPAPVAAVAVAVALAACVVLAWRNLRGWALVAALVVPAAGVVVLCHAQSSNVGWFGMCILVGWGALEAGVLAGVATALSVTAVLVVEWVAPNDESGWGPWIAGIAFTTLACAFARRQRDLLDQLSAAQAGLADRARAEERNRIAAELHDVIGHALTVSLLHVSSAQLALDDDVADARTALAEAERLTRASLDEVRAAVGMMRTTDPASMAPMPTGSDVADLVASFRRAGTPVELDVHGDPASLGATRGLALYRIVQESLTNAARHGDGSQVTVQVDVRSDQTTVTVLSGAHAEPATEPGSGVLGMRERAEAVGGKLLAGPCPEGWRVEAVLPG